MQPTTPSAAPTEPHRAQRLLAQQLAALEADPDDPRAWIRAADAMFALDQPDDALHALRQAAALRPDADLFVRIGSALAHRGVRDEPEAWYRKAVALDPGHREALLRLGHERLQQADADEAGDCFVRILQVHPHDTEAAAGAALVLDRRGDTKDAWRLIQQVVSTSPHNPRVALATATIGPHVGCAQEALVEVRRTLRRIDEPADRVALLFAAGDLYDRLGDHEQAFASWRAANASRGLAFDADAHDRTIDAMIRATQTLPTPTGPDDERPVFVVGMPRSGTTLVERILDGHPRVTGVGELEALRDLAVSVARRARVPTWLHAVSRLERWAPAVGGAYLSGLDRLAPGADRVVDKMPNNALHLGLAAVALPRARVIWCLRDDDDVALSCFSKPMATGLPWAGSIDGIRSWQAGLQRLRGHWQHHLGQRMITVRYEDLVTEPEAQARRLLDHLGVTWDEAVLSPHQRAATVATHSWDQVREPIHRGRIGRAAPYRALMEAAATR